MLELFQYCRKYAFNQEDVRVRLLLVYGYLRSSIDRFPRDRRRYRLQTACLSAIDDCPPPQSRLTEDDAPMSSVRSLLAVASVSNKRFRKVPDLSQHDLLCYWYRRLIVPEALDPVKTLVFKPSQSASHVPSKSVSPVSRHVCVSLPSNAEAGMEINPKQSGRARKAICHNK